MVRGMKPLTLVRLGLILLAFGGRVLAAEAKDEVLLFSYFMGNGEDGLHLATHRQHAQAEPALAVGRAAQEGVLLEGHHEPVDHRATDAEGCGQFGDREPIWGLSHHLQDAQPPVKGLRGLSSHEWC